MTLYLTASTPVRKVFIDFIEVLLCDGRVVSLNWDESGIDWTEDGFSARYKGICFDEEYANGKMEQLQECLLRISQLVGDFPAITELDINPLIISEKNGEGIAVDGRIKVDLKKF